MNDPLFEIMKKYAVKAESIEDFCNKYHRRAAYHERGTEYMKDDLLFHIEEIDKYGYAMIPAGSTTTGDNVTFYGADNECYKNSQYGSW